MPTFLETSVDQLAADGRTAPFDAIVVGGGSAGLTVALTLAEADRHVAVVEAGPVPFLTHISNTDLRFAPPLLRDLRAAVQYNPALQSGGTFGNNYSCLGGRGLFWNGAAPRYDDDELEGWLLGALDLEDYYTWAEDALRVTHFFGKTPLAERIIEKSVKAGFSAQPGPFACDATPVAGGRLGTGIGSGLGYFFRKAGTAVAANRIRIATGATGIRIVASQGRAAGLAVRQGVSEAEVPAKAIVLTGGGIESIKLAAVSGVPDPHRRIGKGLQEHLFYHGLFAAPHLFEPNRRDAAIVYIPADGQAGHQWELHAPGDRLFSTDGLAEWKPDTSTDYQVMIRSFSATEKRDDNCVEAREGPLGSSIVHMSHSPADERKKAEIIESARRLTAALELAATDAAGVDGATRFRALGSSYHEAGGLDMGLDPERSVTDGDGRFHHMKNLISADAAAFPRISATNPHLTIVAVARRKAKALAQSLT